MKKTSIYLLILLAVCPFFIYTSCGKNHDHHNVGKCGDIACTMIFAAVSAEVKNDASGNNIILDEAYTIRTSTGEKITYDQINHPEFYTVLDDSYQQKLQNNSDKFQFIGIKNGIKVVDELYTISADCCHINKESGESVITIQ